MTQRNLLLGLLLAVVLLVALAWSLAPAWPGDALITINGVPVHAASLPIDGFEAAVAVLVGLVVLAVLAVVLPLVLLLLIGLPLLLLALVLGGGLGLVALLLALPLLPVVLIGWLLWRLLRPRPRATTTTAPTIAS